MNQARRSAAVVTLRVVAAVAGSLACGAPTPDAPEPAARFEGAASAPQGTLALTTVTVLSPLPTAARAGWLLGPETRVGDGMLLPSNARPAIGQLVRQRTAEESLSDLRVVCTRFVACARKGAGDCVGQVRFVLQPVRRVDDELHVDDAAVHVLFDLDQAHTRALARRLAALPSANDASPLGVHPGLAAELASTEPEGSSSVAARLRAIAIETAAAGTPSRVTFMANVDVKGNTWVFGGVDIDAAGVHPVTIPRVSEVEQRVVTNGGLPFTVSLSPRPVGEPSLGLLLEPTRLAIVADATPDAAKARVLAGWEAALAIEDPRRHDDSDIDCASCHVTGAARRTATTFASERAFGPLPAPEPVVSGVAASAATAPGRAPAEVLRGCGWVDRTPVVASRTVNDSAIAALELGRLARE